MFSLAFRACFKLSGAAMKEKKSKWTVNASTGLLYLKFQLLQYLFCIDQKQIKHPEVPLTLACLENYSLNTFFLCTSSGNRYRMLI